MEPVLDLTKHPAAPPNQTLVETTQLICSTIDQMNAFADKCEQKLLAVHYKMQRLETEVELLECRLNSISRNSHDPLPAAIATPAATPAATADESTEVHVDLTHAPDANHAEPEISSSVQELGAAAVKVKDDPRFLKYFKMLNFGVPPHAVATAIANETGFPASLLDDPNAAAPPDPEITNCE